MKEVKLYGVISNEGFLGMGENGYIERMANEIKAANGQDLLLRINTPGGSVFDGYAIISNLLEHDGNLNMQVDGYAASMGGAILAYADKVIANDYAYIMLHKAYSYSDNPESQNLVSRLNSDFAQLFKNRGVDADLINEIFLSEDPKDYWFTAQEAKDIGLVDEVIKTNIQQRAAASANNFIEKYYQITNRRSDVVMFTGKEKQILADLKQQVEEILAMKKDFPTVESFMDKVQALVKEETEKITEQLNSDNAAKAEEENTEMAAIKDQVEKISEIITALAKTVKAQGEAVEEISNKLDSTIDKIKSTVTDFEVPETVDAGQPTTQLTPAQARADLTKKVNQMNAERI